MKIHAGCGQKFIQGYTHIDAVSFPHVDVVHTVDKLPMLDDNSVEVFYACHILEHLPRARTQEVLTEWHRILQPGGILRIAVPDFRALARLYLDLSVERPHDIDTDRFGNPLSFALARTAGPVVGGQTGIYDFHQTLFDFDSLRLQLSRAGFTNVQRYDWRTTEHAAIDDYSSSSYPHLDFENGRLLSLNVEATKP